MRARAILSTALVSASAFAVGLYWSDGSAAVAGPPQEEAAAPDMQAQMEAWAKAGQPGPHHAHLDALVGEWHGTFEMWMEPGAAPMTSAGTIKREWVMGGRFIKETVEAKSDMGDFTGLGFIGFNNQDGRYEWVWMEDMSTAIMRGTGYYDEEAKTFHWQSAHRDPMTNRVVDTWATLEATSPGQHVYGGWMVGTNGQRFQNFRGEFERR